MLKTKEILRLKHEVGLSLREIAQVCNCGKTTVSEILGRAEKAEITWSIEISDKQLMSLIYPPAETRKSPPEPDMEYVFHKINEEIKRHMDAFMGRIQGTASGRNHVYPVL